MSTEFTPFLSLLGGMMIGLAAVFLFTLNGQIAGISGMVAKLFPPQEERNKIFEALAFIVGLIIASPIFLMFAEEAPEFNLNGGVLLYGVAGLIVGIGTMLGSGCTSGHGGCGISRFSTRSIIATCTFVATGAVTVFILRHLVGS